MPTVFLLTGSNIGDSLAYLQQAKQSINIRIGEVVAATSLYKTAPWGNKNQQDFLNQVLQVDSRLGPHELLKTILQIEQEMGRNRIEKWGPRIIDIDILFYDDLVLNSAELKIPHPFLQQRRFALMPLCEIAPEFIHPVLNLQVSDLLFQCPDDSAVEKM